MNNSQTLQVSNLRSGYGDSQVLDGIDLAVPSGAGVAVLGRNGMGKSTLLNTIMGIVSPRSGTVHVEGVDVTGRPIHKIARAGLRIVPQGRRVFSSLTVDETLQIAATGHGDAPWTIERVYETFGSLAERRNNKSDQLSGGEQEMLVLARALLGNPTCLLLDEPSDGLAPKVVEQVSEIILGLRAEGLSVLLVEQNLQLAVATAEQVYCLVRGQIGWHGTTDEFRRNRAIAMEYLGTGVAG